jgi:Novel Ras effector 1 C-terminal SARAH (Sav/Rassf/Hpo) domain
VQWEVFSVPELENFLLMLGLEERDSIERVKVKYFRLRILLLRRLAELNRVLL